MLLLLLQSGGWTSPSQRRGLAERELPPRPLLLRLHLLRMLAGNPGGGWLPPWVKSLILPPPPRHHRRRHPKEPPRCHGRPLSTNPGARRLCRAGCAGASAARRVGRPHPSRRPNRHPTEPEYPRPAHARWPHARFMRTSLCSPASSSSPRRGWLVCFGKLAVRSVRLGHDGAAAEAASPAGPARTNARE